MFTSTTELQVEEPGRCRQGCEYAGSYHFLEKSKFVFILKHCRCVCIYHLGTTVIIIIIIIIYFISLFICYLFSI